MSIYKACDIRGAFGKELTVEHASALGHALAVHSNPKSVLVAGDSRLSTPLLKDALIGALVECGVKVMNLGTTATPVFYYARRKLGTSVGVMVTASHNPASDNGFKIALGDLPIGEDELAEIRRLMESGAQPVERRRGQIIRVSVIDDYGLYVESLFSPNRGQFKIVADAGNGMLGPLAPRVIRSLGYDLVELFSEVDGRFPNHPPNPAIAANLKALAEQVRATSADLGVAYDGDGDRVAFVDERGEPVDNDRIIVLFVRAALEQDRGAEIVFDQKCSDIVREEIRRDGGVPRMEKSGHTFIKTTFLKSHAAYAGELSGHHFFQQVGGDDALVASLKMAALVQASGAPLSELVGRIPRYTITPEIRLSATPEQAGAIIAAIRNDLRGTIEKSELDGVRAQYDDGWGIVRASVTEPAITLRFEGHTPEALERIKTEFARAAPQLAGKI